MRAEEYATLPYTIIPPPQESEFTQEGTVDPGLQTQQSSPLLAPLSRMKDSTLTSLWAALTFGCLLLTVLRVTPSDHGFFVTVVGGVLVNLLFLLVMKFTLQAKNVGGLLLSLFLYSAVQTYTMLGFLNNALLGLLAILTYGVVLARGLVAGDGRFASIYRLLNLRFSPKRISSIGGCCSLDEATVKIWGVPGGHVAASKELNKAAVAKGVEGEKRLGAALNKLAMEHPHVRVFHGLHFAPGASGPHDVDHCLLIGNRVFLLDAKNWFVTNHSWGPNGEVLREGKAFNGGDVSIGEADLLWKQYLANHRVHAEVTTRIVLSGDDSERYSYSVDNSRAPHNLSLITIKDLVKELEAEASSFNPVVDRRLVALIGAQMF